MYVIVYETGRLMSDFIYIVTVCNFSFNSPNGPLAKFRIVKCGSNFS